MTNILLPLEGNQYEIVRSNSSRGVSEQLGIFDSIDELSRSWPISSIEGLDVALMGVDNPDDWDVIVYLLTPDGERREISDPRIFIEELDLLF